MTHSDSPCINVCTHDDESTNRRSGSDGSDTGTDGNSNDSDGGTVLTSKQRAKAQYVRDAVSSHSGVDIVVTYPRAHPSDVGIVFTDTTTAFTVCREAAAKVGNVTVDAIHTETGTAVAWLTVTDGDVLLDEVTDS